MLLGEGTLSATGDGAGVVGDVDGFGVVVVSMSSRAAAVRIVASGFGL
jgi:hypothetical protein